MEAENGREFDPAPSKQDPQAFAFFLVFERKSLCGLGDHAQRVTNKFLIFLSFILFPFFLARLFLKNKFVPE